MSEAPKPSSENTAKNVPKTLPKHTWRNRIVLFFVALAVAAMLLGDVLVAFGEERGVTVAAPMVQLTAGASVDDGRILVAQEERRKRRTLFDLLFGEEEAEPEPPPTVEKPVVRKPEVAELPPPAPTIEKAPGATRLAVFGDSMATDIGKALERFYEQDPNLLVLTQGVGSSGIVRTDFFDWPKAIADEIEKDSFDIAVIAIGINDRQKLRIDGVSYGSLTPEWNVEYTARISGILQALRTANKPTIWVGLPPMEPPKFAQAMLQLNDVQRLAVFSGGAEFLDIYERFASEDGKYTSRGPDLNGTVVRMRKDDGIHFSTAGADKLAFYLSQSLRTYYRGGGTVGIQVADPLLGTEAQNMVRPPYQGLGQMKLLEVAGAVISLTHTPRRATDLILATGFSDPTEDKAGFDMTQLIDAPVGRADAFWVGKEPVVPEEEVLDAAALQ